jgi:hypothetical protein
MKTEADVVDLDEYIKVRLLYLEARDCLTIAKQQVSQANKVIVKMETAISIMDIEYKAVLKALDSYGELVQFPTKMS